MEVRILTAFLKNSPVGSAVLDISARWKVQLTFTDALLGLFCSDEDKAFLILGLALDLNAL